MSPDYPDKEPLALADSASTFAPAATVVAPRTLVIEFTGSGSEYFRIWIVNLLLIVVTLGLYFPWAKVRRLRYFYGNTVVDGDPLGFHGSAWTMFKGFVVVAVFMGLYSLAGHFSQGAGFVAFLVIAGLWPALLKASMQFRMANTSWRGLRFGFSGSTVEAYRACLPLFVPGLLLLGLMLLAPAGQGQGPTQQTSPQWLGVFVLVILFTVTIAPWLMWNLKSFQHRHYRFSSETTRFTVLAKSYYWLSLKILGVAVLAYVFLIIVFVGAGLMASVATSKGPMAGILMGTAAVFLSIVAFSAIKPYAVTRFQNLIWNGTESENLQFESNLAVRSMVGLTLKNWFLILLTLGLYWPAAAVAMARLRLAAVQVSSRVSPENLLASSGSLAGQAIGDASGDFLGFDIGL